MFLARDLLLFSVVTSSILQCSLFGNSVSKLVSGQSCCAMLHMTYTRSPENPVGEQAENEHCFRLSVEMWRGHDEPIRRDLLCD